ncbi:MAG: hypothetical protein ACRDD7_07420, partial [Peptostreptococcaceae bacterium]
MEQYMVPNSRDNNIEGINKVIIKGNLTHNDIELISSVFDMYIIKKELLTIQLNKHQLLVFEESNNYSVDISTNCNNQDFNNKIINIENMVIQNMFNK